MRVSLIGMAGTGKSYWAEKLSRHGFRWICCDALIAERLSPELRRPDGIRMDMGEWMGLPYEAGYPAREAKYLGCEIEVLEAVFREFDRQGAASKEDTVLDTTGSVIYTGEEMLRTLKRYTTIVYLNTPPEVLQAMVKAYVARPGPVLWRGTFERKGGETLEEALTASYERLLAARTRLYERHAEVTVDYYDRRSAGFGVPDFLRRVWGRP